MRLASLKPFLPPVVVDAGRRLLGRNAVATEDNGPGLPYISAADTVAAAAREGLSVRDYIERLWDQQGFVTDVIEKIAAHGVLRPGQSVLEIGAGTGRYLDEIMARYAPRSYEVYETARDWSAWLEATYPATVHIADGNSLKETPDASVDVVLAFGVFVYLPYLVAARYFAECCRVLAPDGWIVFDAMTEGCYDTESLHAWIAADYSSLTFLSRQHTADYFAERGVPMVGAFYRPYGAARSEMLIFRRN